MARLIIGHTTHNSANIWVRGDRRNPHAFVNVRGDGYDRTNTIALEERFGYTGVTRFGGLAPASDYQCQVTFGETAREPEPTRVEFGHTSGSFRTFRHDENSEAKFLLISCNLHSLGLFQNPDRSFRTLLKLAASENVDFVVHCGDQIYYDIPNFLKRPDFEEYREKYLDAWGDSRPTRKLLTQLPHYMILDDHELVNNFSNSMPSTPSGAPPGDIKKHGIRVYREFQHIHNPESYRDQALYYYFNHGGIQFFCLDTRSERVEHESNAGRSMMINDLQMERFKRWLRRHRDAMKFVVTSVPFVGHVENNTDKWCSPAFRRQREEIMAYILSSGITGLTFLTGDMHNSYHATLEIERDGNQTVVHELMSSPVNQTSKSSLGKYLRGNTIASLDGRFRYTSQIEAREFYNRHSNAMLVTVQGRQISYEVIRTSNGRRNQIQDQFTV